MSNDVTEVLSDVKTDKTDKKRKVDVNLKKDSETEIISSSFKTTIIFFAFIGILGLGIVCSAQKEQIKILNNKVQALEFVESNNEIQMGVLQKDSDKLNKIKEILK